MYEFCAKMVAEPRKLVFVDQVSLTQQLHEALSERAARAVLGEIEGT